jgi:hypothetical protein
MVRRDPRGNFRAGHVLFEAFHIKAQLARKHGEQGGGITALPQTLFLVEQVMHFPEFALLMRSLGGLGRFARVGMHGEREMPKNDAHLPVKILLELMKGLRHLRARRTFEIAKFFERYQRFAVAANVQAAVGGILVRRGSRELMGAVKRDAGAEGDQGNRHDDDERQVTFHSGTMTNRRTMSVAHEHVQHARKENDCGMIARNIVPFLLSGGDAGGRVLTNL